MIAEGPDPEHCLNKTPATLASVPNREAGMTTNLNIDEKADRGDKTEDMNELENNEILAFLNRK
jgi:hypothetical protein